MDEIYHVQYIQNTIMGSWVFSSRVNCIKTTMMMIPKCHEHNSGLRLHVEPEWQKWKEYGCEVAKHHWQLEDTCIEHHSY